MTAEPTSEQAPAAPPEQSSVTFVGTFDAFGLSEPFQRGLKDLGYGAPTKVQSEVFAPVVEGRDVLVQSRTGSGKTTAFALPVLTRLDPSIKRPQAIVLCPTRELAIQVATEATRIGHHTGLKFATIYGGASMRAQTDALDDGAQFVVGTPGRVRDLIRRGYLRLEQIKFAILDEADEMLSMGFWDEVTGILDMIPQQRQTMLFSATLPEQIERAARKYLRDPKWLNLSLDTLNVSTIRHVMHNENDKLSKPRNFLYVLEFHAPRAAIVFCNRRDETEMICSYLRRFGFRAQALNGDMPQSAREKTLARVKAGELDMMVATDIAARGIDISDLSHIFNYDLPEFDEVYVHRCGRTGRIGKKGTAVSLVRGKYLTHLATLKKQFNVPFEEIVLPDEKEILWMQAERLALKLIEEADGVEVEQYRPVAEAMLGRGDVKEILAYLLRQHFSERGSAPRAEAPREDFGGRGAPSRDDRGGRGRDDRGPPRERSAGRDRPPPRALDDQAAGGGELAVEAGADVAPTRTPQEPRADRPERERRPRRDDAPRDDADAPRSEDDATDAKTLYVNIGRDHGVADVTALIAKMSELSGVDVGHFTGRGDLRDHSSHIEVDAEVVEKVAAGLHGKPRPASNRPPAPVPEGAEPPPPEATTIVCEPARPKPRHGNGGPPRGRGGPRRRR